jgi:DNA-binding SARP family transcriptional activator/tetratricopeptide (TPR) repeat protein
MRVRVLGELEVTVDGERLDLGGPKPRDLLGLMVAAEGRPVPVASLIDQIWGDRPPGRVEASLQSYVARLRRTLEPERDARAAAQRLRTHAGGYSLDVPPEDVDARCFVALLDQAHRSVDEAAADLLTDALALWHGDAYAGTGSPVLQAESTRLGELRLGAEEKLLRLRIDQGRHVEACAELEQLVRTHPLREQLWVLLALALYRSSRQGDALAALRRAREHLAEELGVDPGPELREMEEAVLRQDPGLTSPAQAARAQHGAPKPGDPAPGPDLTPVPLVFGREAELAAVAKALTEASAGRGRTVLVTGEPGIGKTRFTEAVLAEAAGRGFRTGRGCWEPEAAPPLWGWSRALREAFGEDGALRTESTDAVSASYRQAEALLEVLRTGPAVLVLDDVHWADAESLRLLRRLASEIGTTPTLLVAAMRSGPAESSPALIDALAGLVRLDPLRVDLTGLATQDVASWVREHTGVDVSADVARRLTERTDGNPFFVTELVRVLVTEGALSSSGSPAWETVPTGVRDVVRHRLETLDPTTADVAAHAAVVGRTFDVSVLATAADHPLETVDEAVESLQVLGLVEDTGPGTFRFTHALVRDAVYERLTATARARAHGRVGAALEQHSHGEVATHAPELADHYRLAGPAYARSAWLFAETAARTASDRSAHDEALRLLTEAARLQERDDASTAAERERVLLGEGRALVRLGRPLDAWHRVARAGRSALDRGDVDAAAVSLLTVTEDLVWGWRQHPNWDDEAIRLWQDVLTVVPETDQTTRAMLTAGLAVELFFKPGCEDESLRLAEEALAQVRRATNDPAERLSVFAVVMGALLRPDLLARRAGFYEELIDLAARVGTPSTLAVALTSRAADLLEQGRLDEARADVGRATDIAERHRLSQNLMITGWCRALLRQVESDWVGAEELLTGLEDFMATLSMSGWGISLVQLATMRELHGRLPELEGALRAAAPYHPTVRDLHALALVRAGDPAGARLAIGGWAQQPPLPRDYLFVTATVVRAWLWIGLEDAAAVRELRADLTPYADRLASGAQTVAFLGSVELALGELTAAEGDPDVARGHLERARARHAELGLDFWVERTDQRLAALPG